MPKCYVVCQLDINQKLELSIFIAWNKPDLHVIIDLKNIMLE